MKELVKTDTNEKTRKDLETISHSSLEPIYSGDSRKPAIREEGGVTGPGVIALVRFYTGYGLAMELLKIKIHLTGTVMANRRGLPVPVKQGLKLKKKTVSFSRDNKIMLLGWKDKRLVLMLSTFHGSDCEKVQHTIKRGAIEELDKPSVICDYTSKMGAVDRADHYCASYAFTRVVEEYVLLAAGSSNCEQ
ncbi:UNVERIFIED_CONTAM: hypothetical protein FKN15_071153 [Acipenser sinensis]